MKEPGTGLGSSHLSDTIGELTMTASGECPIGTLMIKPRYSDP